VTKPQGFRILLAKAILASEQRMAQLAKIAMTERIEETPKEKGWTKRLSSWLELLK
jgi:hypothetical protein